MSAAIGVLGGVVAACGDGSGDLASVTLPPIITTTTTTTRPPTQTTVPTRYRVKSGDILTVIAAKFHVSLKELMALNRITRPDHIERGQILKLPKPIPTTTTSTTTTSTIEP